MEHVIFNSLALGRFERNLRKVLFKLILMIGGWGIFCKIALRWMSMDLTDDESTLIQVMAWCRQATSHYLSQCWPRSLLPYVIKPQWVKYVHHTIQWKLHLEIIKTLWNCLDLWFYFIVNCPFVVLHGLTNGLMWNAHLWNYCTCFF